MRSFLKPLLSLRFLKFCAVGLSGVGVNLGALALLADGAGLQVNLASALAIEISINSNFFINEAWTFGDHGRGKSGLGVRWARFHLVSLVGAIVQWLVFIAANVLWLVLVADDGTADYFTDRGGWLETYVLRPISQPPEVGHLKYLSQLMGIGAATLWNFLANFYWTWRRETSEETND